MFLFQIVDDEGNEVSRGEEGNIGLKVHPERPVGLFSQYVVSLYTGVHSSNHPQNENIFKLDLNFHNYICQNMYFVVSELSLDSQLKPL